MGRVGGMARVRALLTTQGLPVFISDVPTAKLVVVKPRWHRHPEAPTRPVRRVWVGRAEHRDHPTGRSIVQAKRGRGVDAFLVASDFAVGWQDRAPAVAGPCVFAVGRRWGWWTHDCCTGEGGEEEEARRKLQCPTMTTCTGHRVACIMQGTGRLTRFSW